MLVEQTATYRYRRAATGVADIEIQLTVRLERPYEPYGQVSIWHKYESPFPDELWDLWDALRQRIYDGAHAGLALSGVDFVPNTIIAVTILDLQITPLPQSIQQTNDIRLGFLLEAATCGIVETLLRSFEALTSGQESYFDCPEPPSNASGDEP